MIGVDFLADSDHEGKIHLQCGAYAFTDYKEGKRKSTHEISFHGAERWVYDYPEYEGCNDNWLSSSHSAADRQCNDFMVDQETLLVNALKKVKQVIQGATVAQKPKDFTCTVDVDHGEGTTRFDFKTTCTVSAQPAPHIAIDIRPKNGLVQLGANEDSTGKHIFGRAENPPPGYNMLERLTFRGPGPLP